ncbi:TetR/AcrR family transcriptional regulator [Nocardia beijingensis]|uniref:TetR/AcrR family transcriptional regulator n=1 Tax=Nocardia beijingensis TaxID=95162 RepID=UPI00331849D8
MSGRAAAVGQVDQGSVLRGQPNDGSAPQLPQVADRLSARKRSALRTRAALVRSGRWALGSGIAGRIGIAGLAREAGVATGSFYSHFSSKDDLFDTVLAEVIGELVWKLDSAAASVDDSAGIVVAHLRAIGEVGIGHPDIAAIILTMGYRLLEDPDVRSRLAAGIRAGIAAERFHIHDLNAALDLVGGVALAILRISQRDPAALTAPWMDILAQQTLTALGHR